MRLFKLFTTASLVGLIALFLYENLAMFTSRLPFMLDLYIREQVNWDHPVYAVLLFAFVLGFLAGVAVMLKPFLQMRRLIGQERENKDQVRAVVRAPQAAQSEGAGQEEGQAKAAQSPVTEHAEEPTKQP